jgi:hypothetical protein
VLGAWGWTRWGLVAWTDRQVAATTGVKPSCQTLVMLWHRSQFTREWRRRPQVWRVPRSIFSILRAVDDDFRAGVKRTTVHHAIYYREAQFAMVTQRWLCPSSIATLQDGGKEAASGCFCQGTASRCNGMPRIWPGQRPYSWQIGMLPHLESPLCRLPL